MFLLIIYSIVMVLVLLYPVSLFVFLKI